MIELSPLIATISLPELWDYLRTPWLTADWTAWREFWLMQVLDDRLWIVYAIPFVPILYFLPQRYLRAGLIVTGFAFIGVLFGAFYMAFWIVLCLGLYWLSERFAIEFRRTDVLPIGPPLGAWVIIGGGYFASFFLSLIRIDHDGSLTRRLFEAAPWLFPMGLFTYMLDEPARAQAATLAANGPGIFGIFWLAHNIGTAYLAVRMLQYLSEIKRGNIPPEQRSLSRFLAFVAYAPTVMQGPIERYDRFCEQIETCVTRRRVSDLGVGLWRIALGVFKALISTLYFVPVVRDTMLDANATYYMHPEQIHSYAFLYFGVYINIFWLYLEFSGYCDIAIGISRILGYRLIENFRYPWIATSMRDFWRRWHISLSMILRDYIYIPLGGNRRHTTLNLCLTFALVGIWHGPFLQLAVWGAVMGLMVAINQHWVQWMKRLDPREHGLLPKLRRAIQRTRPLPQILSWAFTMHCFCHSLLIFFGGSAVLRIYWELIRRPLGW